jgi:hypothetical protein
VPTARAGSRPALARRTAATGTTRRTAAPQPRRFTGRAAILAAVFVVLALGYTYPVRVYLAQKSDIARMEAATAAKEARIAELTEEAAKWQDDEYVKTQARKRFFYVRPGEVPLIVMDDPEGAARDAGRATSAPPPPVRHALVEHRSGRQDIMTQPEPPTAHDLAAVAAQLGRPPRGTRAVAHRCPCGNPDVVQTEPRLPDGTPFPTMFYLTCPRATAACSRLESQGLMREMAARLAEDPDLAARYRAAHDDYLARRDAVDQVAEIAGVSAGGMPDRVKCLHVHLGHALAAGRGVNPFGDEVRELVGAWWHGGPCVS